MCEGRHKRACPIQDHWGRKILSGIKTSVWKTKTTKILEVNLEDKFVAWIREGLIQGKICDKFNSIKIKDIYSSKDTNRGMKL